VGDGGGLCCSVVDAVRVSLGGGRGEGAGDPFASTELTSWPASIRPSPAATLSPRGVRPPDDDDPSGGAVCGARWCPLVRRARRVSRQRLPPGAVRSGRRGLPTVRVDPAPDRVK